VDDNEDHRFLTRRAIGQLKPAHDVEVVMAASGGEALGIASATPRPDLVLLDVKMPGTDGFEVLKRLRDEPSTRDLWVVMFSSSENDADQARATALGASGFVTKPLDARGFVETVRATVEMFVRRAARPP
jgi:CheY-like chemotaxis protein